MRRSSGYTFHRLARWRNQGDREPWLRGSDPRTPHHSDGLKTPRSSPGSRSSRGGLPRPSACRKVCCTAERADLRPTDNTYDVVPTSCGSGAVTMRCPGDDEPGLTTATHRFDERDQHPRLACSRPTRRFPFERGATRASLVLWSWPPISGDAPLPSMKGLFAKQQLPRGRKHATEERDPAQCRSIACEDSSVCGCDLITCRVASST